MESSTPDPLLGLTLDGRFRLDRLLGQGGMGRVYEATQLSVGRTVAVKVILDSQSQHPIVRQRFLREAQVVATFTHPSIVRLIDFGEDAHLMVRYLAMDYVRGLPLTAVMKRGPLQWPHALRIIACLAQGLTEAHAAGVVHRDLKPDNVMLSTSADGSVQPLLLDFGVALPQAAESTKLTDVGAVCGTPQYMAPEQAKSGEIGPPADLYALGVIGYEMLTGHLPFQGGSGMAIMVKKVNEPAPSLEAAFATGGEIPPEVGRFVDALLAADPAARTPTARHVTAQVEGLLGTRDFTLRTDPGDDPFLAWYGTARPQPSTEPQHPGISGTVPTPVGPGYNTPMATPFQTPDPGGRASAHQSQRFGAADPSQRFAADPSQRFPAEGVQRFETPPSKSATITAVVVALLAGAALVGAMLMMLSDDSPQEPIVTMAEREARAATAAREKLAERPDPTSPDDDEPQIPAALEATPRPDAGLSDAGTHDGGGATAVANGCGQQPSFQGQKRAVMSFRGIERAFTIFLPKDYDPNVAHPVLLLFHKQLSSGPQAIQTRGFVPIADRERFVIIAPGSLPDFDSWIRPEDTDFVKQVLFESNRLFCLDTERVYATGHGAGEFMAERMNCSMSLSAIAGSGHRAPPGVDDCLPDDPAPFMHIWGKDNQYLRREGGTMCNLKAIVPLDSKLAHWRSAMRCKGRPEPYSRNRHGSCEAWTCDRAKLVSCEVEGGHEWPGEKAGPVFPMCRQGGVVTKYPYAEEIWKFFESEGRKAKLDLGQR